MRPGGGKVKGSRFERLVARELSGWLTGGKNKRQLIRSVLSGGWAKGKPDWRQVGDLAPNGSAGEHFRSLFAVECKHTKSLSLWQLWYGGDLHTWWAQLVKDAAVAGVRPMLVFRENARPAMVLLPDEAYPEFNALARVAHLPSLKAALVPFTDLLAQDPDVFLSAFRSYA
jgi:hypothetical protein